MSLKNHINLNFIWTDPALDNTDQLFDMVSQKATELGYVEPDFLDKIKKREQSFPTGLQCKNYSIAIPHTDPCTIKKQFISIILSQKKLKFHLMDDPDTKIPVDAVFILGLNNSESHLVVLQEIMAFIQNDEKMKRFTNCKNSSEVLPIFLSDNTIN